MNAPRRLRVLMWIARHLEAKSTVHNYAECIRKVFDGHDIEVVSGPEAWRGKMHGVQVLVCWGFSPDLLKEADSLEWVQFGSSGINHALSPELLASPVRIGTLKGVHPIPVAEHVIALILAQARGLRHAIACQLRAEWSPAPIFEQPREVTGSWVGVVGMGRIGREAARRCRALGAHVIATRSSQTSGDEADQWVDRENLDALLAKADWVVLALPQAAGTGALIGERELGLMKPEAVLVNVARGPVVDESALIRALTDGRLGGACLDVFTTEPLPPDSPLWAMENVIITPHTAGASPDYCRRGAQIVAANLKAFLAGERMPTEFDRAKGY